MTNKALDGYGSGTRMPILGYAAWYTISAPRIEYDPLKAKITELGLDPSILPAQIRPGDAFKRACRYSKNAKIPLVGTENYANILIREVAQDSEAVERHMIIEICDPQNRRLEFETAASLVLNKNRIDVRWEHGGVEQTKSFTRRVDAQLLLANLENREQKSTTSTVDDPKIVVERTPIANGSQYRSIIDEAIDKFVTEYEDARNFLDAQTLRQMVRRQLTVMRSFKLKKTGSVYYVPKSEEAQAIALINLLDWMGDDSNFHILPLIDADKQREMMQAAFESEVHEHAQTMLSDVSEALRSGSKINASTWVEFLDRKERLLAQAREYSDLVQKEFTKAGIELALLDDAMTKALQGGLVKAARGS